MNGKGMNEDTSDGKLSTMQMLVEVEEAAGRLYEKYGQLFPLHEEFWLGLTVEKGDQASVILDLINLYNNGRASFKENGGMVEDVKSILVTLKDALQNAKKKKLSFEDALSKALDIEKSFAARRFHRMFEGGSPEAIHILELLDTYSNNHIRILEIELKHHHAQ